MFDISVSSVCMFFFFLFYCVIILLFYSFFFPLVEVEDVTDHTVKEVVDEVENDDDSPIEESLEGWDDDKKEGEKEVEDPEYGLK